MKTKFKNLFVRQIAIKSPGRPKLSQNITAEIKSLALTHPKWSLQTLARAVGVSKTSVYNALNKR
ncbi:helix-turn-helix domain-containing protein [Lacticaseibacillus paracasei]|nr:helix-turn-helix domain-containing protein [Lacticaseibacillus paracasei]